jgi:hypothetical protein
MTAATIDIEADELLGLSALAELEAAYGGRADVTSTAKSLMHDALAAKLEEHGLPWAPSPETSRRLAVETAQADSALTKLARSDRARKYTVSALAVAALVVLWGGYVRGWQWTGFRQNDQLWDWLHLLLLPVVVGTIPLWIRHGHYISRTRRMAYTAALAGFAVLVAAGYLVPLNWTGFRGMTLWNWYGLILLPLAVATLGIRPSGRPLRRRQKEVAALIGFGWVATVAGGYLLHWAWTGYAGSTLWDWLQLLLLPLVFPTFLLPGVLRWVTGNAAQRARTVPEADANARAVRELAPDTVQV